MCFAEMNCSQHHTPTPPPEQIHWSAHVKAIPSRAAQSYLDAAQMTIFFGLIGLLRLLRSISSTLHQGHQSRLWWRSIHSNDSRVLSTKSSEESAKVKLRTNVLRTHSMSQKTVGATGFSTSHSTSHPSLTVVRSLQMSPTIWAHSSDHCLANSWLQCNWCVWDKDPTTARTKASTSRSTSAQTSNVVRMHCFSSKTFRWCQVHILDFMKSGVCIRRFGFLNKTLENLNLNPPRIWSAHKVWASSREKALQPPAFGWCWNVRKCTKDAQRTVVHCCSMFFFSRTLYHDFPHVEKNHSLKIAENCRKMPVQGLTAPDAALYELLIANVGVGCDTAIALEARLAGDDEQGFHHHPVTNILHRNNGFDMVCLKLSS